MTFARYRRPAPTSYNITKPSQNLSYNSSYNERVPVQSSRTNRNSSHSISRLNRDNEHHLGLHQKTQSQGNLAANNLAQSMTYDADYNNAYNSNQNEAPRSAQKPPSSRGSRHKGASFDQNNAGMAPQRTQNVNHTISYDSPDDKILPAVHVPKTSDSPKLSRSYKSLKPKTGNRLYDSLDAHVSGALQNENGPHARFSNNRAKLNSSLSHIAGRDVNPRTDVERQSLEQDRYFSRLNKANSKQQQIFEKYLVEQLVPNKDKEKHLEEIEKMKRMEAKTRLDALDKGSRLNQKALKKEYQKFLSNQMKQREREMEYQSQAKRDQLSAMKNFAAMEQMKDKEERKLRVEMQTAYRNALQSQEYLKAKQKLNTEVKLHKATVHGGTADSLYTFGGTFVPGDNKKGYIPPNPIVNPVSDPMYNPYLRKDIVQGIHEIKR